MADKQSDFPTLENEAGITPVEAEEIRVLIEKVATENRIPVEAGQFSLTGARRGLVLPSLVNLGALVVVGIAVLVIVLVFGRTQQRVQTQATQYASIEGKLIRELRTQSTQQLSAKEKEIEEVRTKVHELEQQQQALADTYNQKLKQKEEELRQKQSQDVTDERARLLSQGVSTNDLQKRMATFEAERKAFYEKQLAEYRKGLDAERAQLQADITRLRAEYTSRLDQLEKERRQIVTDFQQRESTLRVQMQQKTEVLDRLRTQSAVNLDAAQKQLAALGQQQEQVQSVSNQVDGQIARISQDLAAGQPDQALAQVRSLQAYIRQGSVRSVPQLSDRLRSESFLLEQLGSLLEDRVQAQAASGTQSLASELELLGRIRGLSQQAAAAKGAARLDDYRQLIAAMPEVQGASAALIDAATQQAVDDLQKKMRDDTEENTKAAVQLIGTGDYAAALAKYKAALNTSPAIAPDSARLLTDLLVLGYRISDYTRTGQKNPGVDALASQAGIDLVKERSAFLSSYSRTDATNGVISAAAEQEQALRNQLKDSDALNEQLKAQLAQAGAAGQAEINKIAAQVKTTRQDLVKRLDALLAFENEVNAAHTAYTTYVSQEQAARTANPQDPVTASRQELNKFLRSDAVKALFPDTAARVDALYTANQAAGSSAALANAQDIITKVASQPTLKASRQQLQFEIGDAAGDAQLSAILKAVDGVLAKAQGAAQ